MLSFLSNFYKKRTISFSYVFIAHYNVDIGCRLLSIVGKRIDYWTVVSVKRLTAFSVRHSPESVSCRLPRLRRQNQFRLNHHSNEVSAI